MSTASTGEHRRLELQAVWGDITAVEAEAYAVGHYQGVQPAGAEWAIDRAMAGSDEPEKHQIAESTRRGMIHGELGDVDQFRWADPPGVEVAPALVLVGGMGQPGTFVPVRARTLFRNVAWSAAMAGGVETLAMVAIGSGADNMPVEDVVDALIEGVHDCLGDPAASNLKRILVVELDLGRAMRVDAQLRALEELDPGGGLDIEVLPLRNDGNGAISRNYALAAAVAALREANETAETLRTVMVDHLAGLLPGCDDNDRRRVLQELLGPGSSPSSSPASLAERAAMITIANGEVPEPTAPTRISYELSDGQLVGSAISDSATVTKRPLGIDVDLLQGVVAETHQERNRSNPRLSSTLLTQMLLPKDFGALLQSRPALVMTVDRVTAQVPWELLYDRVGGELIDLPLGATSQMSRQLKTELSPPPTSMSPLDGPLRVLIIGDPGGLDGDPLWAARAEAIESARYLRRRGADGSIEVELLLGHPSDDEMADDAAGEATKYQVAKRLLTGTWDVVHYAGHATFDDDDPERGAGWLFSDGLLQGAHLQGLMRAPQLVVANACYASRVSDVSARSAASVARLEAALLPGLVDELLRRGVRNLIGAGWPVRDDIGKRFARSLYSALVPNGTGRPATIGEAMLAARTDLLGSGTPDWAAYQHYGDPTSWLRTGRRP